MQIKKAALVFINSRCCIFILHETRKCKIFQFWSEHNIFLWLHYSSMLLMYILIQLENIWVTHIVQLKNLRSICGQTGDSFSRIRASRESSSSHARKLTGLPVKEQIKLLHERLWSQEVCAVVEG